MNHEPVCRLFLVDDHPAVREGLTLVLRQASIEVCGEAAGSEQTLQRVPELRPDLVLVDLSLSGESGLGLIRELHAQAVPVLVYSMHADSTHIRQAFAAGARGYVTKREPAQVLVQAIQQIVGGSRYISEEAQDALLEADADLGEGDVGFRTLSERELQVLQWMGQGDSGDDIASRLHISPRTVASYYSRIMAKLNLTSMKDLRKYAIQQNQK